MLYRGGGVVTTKSTVPSLQLRTPHSSEFYLSVVRYYLILTLDMGPILTGVRVYMYSRVHSVFDLIFLYVFIFIPF